jgi:DNA-binding MarR family transcriptional regulator
MQVLSGSGSEPHTSLDTAALLDGIIAAALPGRRGVAAWQALLYAHATLLRQLDTDLQRETGLTLGDFDVLGQLGSAGGQLRMTELAARALTSRSGMTRRIDRMVSEGLVCRAGAAGDARAVMVALTPAGVARLAETAPIHLRGMRERFVDPLDDQELAVLERALAKVTVDCTFG